MSEKYYSLTQLKSIMRIEGNQWTDLYEIIHPDDLKKLKPVDVRPVVHGYWTWNPNGMDWGRGAWCCDKCRAKAETWWANDRGYNPLRCSGGHYCGNCGAEMKGVQNG